MSSDDVGDAVGRADLDEVAEDAEDIDEDRSWRDKSPFAVWLLFVFGLPTVVFLLGFVTGQFQFDVTIAATIDISAAAQEALRWLVRLVIFFTAMSILVLLPGDYLAMVLRAPDGFSYQEDDDDE
jgi:hypothetical protein